MCSSDLAEQKEAAKAKKEQEQREQTQRKAEEDKRKAEEAKRKAEEEKRKAEEAKEAEDMRQQQVTRLKSLGASTSGPTEANQEVKGGGKPSDSYLGRLRARVKPNITFSDAQKQSIDGNPTAEVEVFCSPSGQIIGMKLTQSSGVAA